MNTTKYQVTGMTCGHCERAILAEVGQIGGVVHVDVSATTGILVVTSTADTDDAQILGAVEEAGYSAVRF
jgi:copper chaperone CopZ